VSKKEVIALLLAGGQGSRLGVLTKKLAKPAVPYGGKYRIIDFSLSNCMNSNIHTVGVLTQYQPLELNTHIGVGKPWDMDRMNGGVTILSPYMKSDNGQWYKGTANAVCQNIHYIDNESPKYVVILSGDHVYKMDYSKMLDFHKKNNAHGTISVIDVPLNEASRYGIMNIEPNGKIYEFEEKPQNPKSTLASMGVYIFNWDVLREYLIEDEINLNSDNDFGRDIIPNMLFKGCTMMAYKFGGYWKDVGTVEAYWESNMGLINRVPDFDLFDRLWKISTHNRVNAGQYMGPTGSVKRSIIADGCVIHGLVEDSVVFPGVHIKEGAIIKDSIIMPNCQINYRTFINKSILCENVKVGCDTIIGQGENLPNKLQPNIYNSGITVIGTGASIPNQCNIGKNVMVDIDVSSEGFYSLNIPSGQSVFKGGTMS